LKYGHPDAVVLNLWHHKQVLAVVTETIPAQPLPSATGLDAGETETIRLALQQHADLILIDERKARQVARQSGLIVKGTLGVLYEAFQKGLIDATQAEIYLQQIIQQRDIWIAPALCLDVLEHIRKRH
jgi:hypothetical protein